MTRSFRVAVVGAGPAGIYAADALLGNDDYDIEVDVIDRLPTPYGLVRYGVAPDHPKIKSIQSALQRTFEHPGIRFLGDVEIGGAAEGGLTVEDLDELYDAVIYSTGAALGRSLEIPGEELAGVATANSFVSWYSGHPDAVSDFDLDATGVAVIGAGNVALDVARILVKSVDELAATDMPEHVLERLRNSSVTDVHLVIRRGPEQAKFTSKELREFAELDDVGIVLDPQVLPPEENDAAADRHTKNNLAAFRVLAAREVPGASRQVHFHFWRAPERVLGQDAVEGLQVAVMELDEGRLVATDETETLQVQRVFPAVGYLSQPVGTLSFDAGLGRVPNVDGRVVDDDVVVPKRYVAGWVKRGPSGVVGSNRQCAIATVASVLADFAELPDQQADSATSAAGVDARLAERGVTPVVYDGWLAIEQAEAALGESAGKQRTKLHEWDSLRKASVALVASHS